MRQSNDGMLGAMPVPRLVVTMSLPIMLSMLISAVYNLVDSVYVAQYSDEAFLALSYAYPIQMLLVAFCSGIGVGFSAIFSRRLGEGDQEQAASAVCHGFFLYGLCWLLFLLFALTGAAPFLRLSTEDPSVARQGAQYLLICCGLSIGTCMQFLTERILQAMGRPAGFMIVQGSGAILNLILDPIFIFPLKMGVVGAGIATVIGQIVAALVVMRKAFVRSPEKSCYLPHIKRIYQLGIPNILMQSAYTFYIFGLNMILAGFSDQAVTALGLYYKWQSFFFIPLGALQTCIVPVISFNYAAKDQERCKAVLKESLIAGMALMFLGTLCFEFLPVQMLSTFSKDAQVIAIGTNGFHYIGVAFIPMVTSLIFPVYFQAIGSAVKSSILTVVRTMVLFVPLGYLFSRFGLQYFWLTFPVTEVLTTLVGFKFYRSQQA